MHWSPSFLAALLAATAGVACSNARPRAEAAGAQSLGSLDKLHFAVVGASLPAGIDTRQRDPAALVTRIWQGVEDELGHPHFAITTGDAVLAAGLPSGAAQLERYLQARERFHGPVFFAMGEHDGGAAYPAFARTLLTDSGQARPYYTVRLQSSDRSWTAKLVFVAEESWDGSQAAWLRRTLAEPTTYTFVVRHRALGAEGESVGSRASAKLLAAAPYTLLLAGHEPGLRHDPARRQLIVGNGGAQLGDAPQYGYVVARQRSDGAMVLTAYDYETHATAQRFAVQPDGRAAALF